MAKKVFFLKQSGVRSQILKSAETHAMILNITMRTYNVAKNMSGRDYSVLVVKGKKRIWGFVRTQGIRSRLDELRRNTLRKALMSNNV